MRMVPLSNPASASGWTNASTATPRSRSASCLLCAELVGDRENDQNTDSAKSKNHSRQVPSTPLDGSTWAKGCNPQHTDSSARGARDPQREGCFGGHFRSGREKSSSPRDRHRAVVPLLPHPPYPIVLTVDSRAIVAAGLQRQAVAKPARRVATRLRTGLTFLHFRLRADCAGARAARLPSGYTKHPLPALVNHRRAPLETDKYTRDVRV